MDNKPPQLLVECEGCREKFSVTGNDVIKREFEIEEQSIWLTYYDCPKCGKRHFVQIDDKRSNDILKTNLDQFTHNAALKTRGMKLRKKKVDQYKKTQLQLSRHRLGLMKTYQGKMILDPIDKTESELRFSV